MSLAFIGAVVVFAIVAYVTWSNSKNSFSKRRLTKNADQAAHREELGN
jgi:hypothetical protein